jgi:hypothetical protein
MQGFIGCSRGMVPFFLSLRHVALVKLLLQLKNKLLYYIIYLFIVMQIINKRQNQTKYLNDVGDVVLEFFCALGGCVGR